MMMKAARVRCWSDLPDDMVGMIAGRLAIVDYIRFLSICRPWRQAVISGNHLPKYPQMPWLMLAGGGNHDDVGFLDIFTGKIYKPRLGLGLGEEARMWRITEDNHTLVWNNPICNPIAGVDDTHGQLYRFPIIPTPPTLIKSLKPLPLASSTMMATIVVLHKSYNILGFARTGDTSWTWLWEGIIYDDTIFYKGCIYAYRLDIELVECWDITTAELISSRVLLGVNNNMGWESYNKFFVATTDRLMIVCSLKSDYDEELMDDPDYYDEATFPEIVLLEFDDQTTDWKRIWTLGGSAIFVDNFTTVLVDAASLQDPGLRDRIIITRTALHPEPHKVVMSYDLVHRKYDTDNIYTWPQLVFKKTLGWFMPKCTLPTATFQFHH